MFYENKKRDNPFLTNRRHVGFIRPGR